MERFPAIAEALDAFLLAWRLRGYSLHTITSYRVRLRRLPGYISHAHELDRPVCLRYLSDELAAGAALGTLRTTWGALAAFCAYGAAEGWWRDSPLRGVPCPREKVVPRYLSREELQRIWDAACRSRRLPDENKLLILLLLEGLRSAELRALRWQDVHDGTATVRGKGRTVRRIALNAPTMLLLEERRATAGSPLEGSIFRMSGQSLRARVHRLGRAAGVPDVHPHLFRHTFASQFLIEGGDSLALQQLGGWADATMIRTRYAKAALDEASIQAARRLDLTSKLLGDAMQMRGARPPTPSGTRTTPSRAPGST